MSDSELKNECESFIEVSKDQFLKFIKEYPVKLERDVIMFCEPPIETYNDFITKKDWDSVVAKIVENKFYIKTTQ